LLPLLLTLLSLSIGQARTNAHARFPAVGQVTVRVRSPKYDHTPLAFLEFQRPDGKVARFQFEMGNDVAPEDIMDAPFPARFAVVRVRGLNTPLVVATVGSHGGSDASADSTEILVLTFSWTDEAHYSPHYFTVTTLRWNGSRFVERETRTTRRKVPSWRAAAREFGVTCKVDLTELLVPDER